MARDDFPKLGQTPTCAEGKLPLFKPELSSLY